MATVYPGIPGTAQPCRRVRAASSSHPSAKSSPSRIIESIGLAATIGGVYGTEPDGSLDDKAELIAAVLRTE